VTILPTKAMREEIVAALGIDVDAPTTIRNILKRNDLSVEDVAAWSPEPFDGLTREDRAILENRIRYEGYIRRETERVERLKPLESQAIPPDFSYDAIPGLSREVIEKCQRRRPLTLGEASRIPGVTPAAVAVISARVSSRSRARTS
jgi:tRNA uridine 5-carboxymethylaminomethyl modification enzyme